MILPRVRFITEANFVHRTADLFKEVAAMIQSINWFIDISVVQDTFKKYLEDTR